MPRSKPKMGPRGPKSSAGGAGTGHQPRPSGKGSGNSHKSQLTGR